MFQVQESLALLGVSLQIKMDKEEELHSVEPGTKILNPSKVQE